MTTEQQAAKVAADQLAEKRAAEAAQRAEQTMVEKVAYPAFFEKVALDHGLTPANEKVAQELTALSDVLCPAVGRALERYKTATDDTQLAAVKSAADTAKALAGIQLVERPASTHDSFLVDPDVKAAAANLVDYQLKRANLANILSMGAAGADKKPEEEEEEGKEKKPAMPATVTCS